jgi:hypothetical protein
MKKTTRGAKRAPMNADAYAGFLKLLITPPSKLPRPSREIDAYVQHLNEHDPLSEITLRELGLHSDRAA